VPKEDFDFESMNQKFDKATLEDGEVDESKPQAEKKYDKNLSFFDSLSFEKEKAPSGRDRRQSDFETFGETNHNNYYRGRGRGRGRGGRGGYSSYRGGRYQPTNETRGGGGGSQPAPG